MKIKLLKNVSGKYNGNRGDVIDIDPQDEARLVNTGIGEMVKEPKKGKEEKDEPQKNDGSK